jgi:cobyrinic acid a,c-diamide synthase
MISAAHKSSGKTTVSIGLCAALRAQGNVVAPFKKGPDYIDPLWLGEAAQHPCHNLDFYTQSDAEMLCSLNAAQADLTLIEGNKGLHDGMAVDGSNSNAALAKLSHTPVILVLDTRGTTRGIAPLVLGYQQFDREVKIAGVILNRVGGPRHEDKLRAALEYYTEVPVIGAVYQDRHMEIVERHLGLMPSNEAEAAQQIIAKLADAVRAQVDLDAVLSSATQAPALANCDLAAPPSYRGDKRRIGVLRDAAFGFYYPGDFDALQRAGAELVFIDALHDARLPDIDGLFIGGGFPETKMAQLAANHALKNAIRDAINHALPVYAECGGLMYLGRRLSWDEQSAEMCGALPLDTRMYKRPQGRGYVHLQETGAGLWPLRGDDGAPTQFAAHEFHYSRVENLSPGLSFAYKVLRGYGIDGEHDGLVYKNTLASYAHLRDVAQNRWAARFMAFVKTHQKGS